ncbi:putative Ig domain-containing protein [Spirosoma aerolatum]|uniref:putative Ig domain-containing protein n=1 Tax=Spirosoma aerolatum TaxID=1211326 RepID=UPI0009AF02E3|nr:putative Ig domain-containing protein [Spirosoma aerolatum]
MFSLAAFIRQLLPSNLRTDLNVLFIQMLFTPVVTLMKSIEADRQRLLIEARATGQVLILQELCNRVAYNSAIGPIYLLEGNYSTIDFQVIVPPGLGSSMLSNIRGVLDKHKMAGKRYQLVEQAAYNAQPTVIAWETGYPVLSSTKLTWAINTTGTYQTVVSVDGVEILNQAVGYTAGISLEYSNTVGTTFVVTVGSISASLTRNVATGVINRLGYWKFGALLFILPNVDVGDVEVKLVGIGSTNYSDTYQDASVGNNTVSGVSYNRQRIYAGIGNGTYRAYARVKGQTTEVTLDFSLGVANQSPIVSYENPNQTGKVGVFFTYQIPLNTFTDPDGPQPSISVGGYPSPLTYDAPTRTISGTPTATGTHTITVTGTDNQGATVQDVFILTINPADTVDPPPITGASSIVMYNSNVFKPVIQYNSSGMARIVDTSGFSVPSGKNVYYFISGSPYVTSLPTTYDFAQGQTVTIWKLVATSPDRWANTFYAKGFSIIYIGQPS